MTYTIKGHKAFLVPFAKDDKQTVSKPVRPQVRPTTSLRRRPQSRENE